LTCVANDNVSDEAAAELFNYICGLKGNYCQGIAHNGSTGVYGAYSMCSPQQQLSVAMDAYYKRNGASSQNCNFGGNATTTSANLASSCTALLQEAGGAAGTGVVTSTAGVGGVAASSSSAAALINIPAFDFGILAMSVYVTVAAIAGAGIILL
jgi:1,3-beta-glucanosyltransferase GAS1